MIALFSFTKGECLHAYIVAQLWPKKLTYNVEMFPDVDCCMFAGVTGLAAG